MGEIFRQDELIAQERDDQEQNSTLDYHDTSYSRRRLGRTRRHEFRIPRYLRNFHPFEPMLLDEPIFQRPTQEDFSQTGRSGDFVIQMPPIEIPLPVPNILRDPISCARFEKQLPEGNEWWIFEEQTPYENWKSQFRHLLLGSRNPTQTCPICYEECEETISPIECYHEMCVDCTSRILDESRVSPRCPFCRIHLQSTRSLWRDIQKQEQIN